MFCEIWLFIKENSDIIRLILILTGFPYAYWLVIKRDKLWYRRDDRLRIKEVNDWFHETYILKGVDPVLAYISLLKIESPLEFHGNPKHFKAALQKLPEFPMQPLNRLKKILGDDTIERLIISLHKSSSTYTSYPEAPGVLENKRRTMQGLQETEQFLSDLSHELLAIEIEHKLATKDISEYINIHPYKQKCSNLANQYPVTR